MTDDLSRALRDSIERARADRRPRTIDAMYGTGVSPEEAPTVVQVIDGDEYMVDVDLTPAAEVLLQALAAGISNDEAAFAEWVVLMHNTIPSDHGGTRRDLAVRELLDNPMVRRALTVRLAPETADTLAQALDAAQCEPARCEYGGGVRSPEPGCGNYVEFGDRCPAHSDPDDADTVQGYGL